MKDLMIAPFDELWRHRYLAMRLARRDLEARFRGTLLGALWVFLPSVLLVAIYAFVFAGVFRSRWPGGSGGPFEYVQYMFAGLIAYGIVAEAVGRAPTLILQNPNFVKKVVFPLPILVWSSVMVASFAALVNIAVLLVAGAVASWHVPWTAVLVPLALLPLVLTVAAAGLVLAALGVYLRDLQPIISLVLTALLFLSPVFYPIDSLPDQWRWLAWASPLTMPMEAVRALAIRGTVPSVTAWLLALGIASIILAFARWLFARAQRGFADVL